MTLYRVQIPLGAPDPATAAERAAFVREGFSWRALLFGPFWLLARGLWRALVVWCLAALIVSIAMSHGILSHSAGAWLYLLSAVYLGLEGQGLVAAAKERAGFRLIDMATGSDIITAESSFFSRWLHDQPPAPMPSPARPNVPHSPPHIIGMFPEAGG